ncbi:MAG TPA: DUF6510 family protein [Acidimicrobiia bacterium]|jgi:hypothetical protein|nr:DUF6510 family protein [Acidimicrobiia bacterium]
MSDVRHVDGNAVAGLLVEIFGQEMTASRGQCGGCGRIDVLANVMVYRDAPGDVLRCPVCDSVLMVIVEVRTGYRVSFEWLRWVETQS